MSDRELMERIYASQIRIMMDVEKIKENVIALRKKVDPDAMDPSTNQNFNKEKPLGWRHYSQIHDTFDESYNELTKQMTESL